MSKLLKPKIAFAKAKKHLPLFLRFSTGQAALQLLNILNGFFLLRWLNIEELAIFGLAFSIQTVLTNFSDMGISSSIIALTGPQINDPKIVGNYMKAARQLRVFFFSSGIIISVVLFFSLFKETLNASIGYSFILIPIILSAFFQINTNLYSTALLMQKDMNALYVPQIKSSLIRIIVNWILYMIHFISALSSTLINAAVLLYTSLSFKRKANPFFSISTSNEGIKEYRKKMLKYLYPLIPSLLFYTFYGQIQIFIISFFGKIQSIAEVAALGRLGQIFALFNAATSTLIVPVIAKSAEGTVFKKYLLFVFLAVSLCAALMLVAYFIPDLYLLLLGDKFYHLKREVPIMILNASAAFIAVLFWQMNNARKWVFWLPSWIEISLIVIAQILAISFYDLSNTRNVLLLTAGTSILVLLVHMCVGAVGLLKIRKT